MEKIWEYAATGSDITLCEICANHNVRRCGYYHKGELPRYAKPVPPNGSGWELVSAVPRGEFHVAWYWKRLVEE